MRKYKFVRIELVTWEALTEYMHEERLPDRDAAIMKAISVHSVHKSGEKRRTTKKKGA